jgi:Ca2+-binding RTX toxin-like protein
MKNHRRGGKKGECMIKVGRSFIGLAALLVLMALALLPANASHQNGCLERVDRGHGWSNYTGNSADECIGGTSGPDHLEMLGGSDYLEGLGGGDTLQGSGGADFVRGDEGNDDLFAGAGNDDLEGGPGLDRLVGGEGMDNLSGNGGDDTLIHCHDGSTDDIGGIEFHWADTDCDGDADYLQ